MTLLSTLALTTALGGGGGPVTISEIRIDQPGSDNDEFFELAGPPGTDLTNVYYISIGDGSAGSGVVESITDLTGSVIPPSGYFVAAEDTFSLGTADLVVDLNFENSDNVTHMLVVGFTGAFQDDLDTNDDGMLDVFPFSGVLDAVSLVETEYTGDRYYANVQFGGAAVGPQGNFVPGHAFRCTAGWQIGDFGTGSTETPGAANSPVCPGPRINEIRIDQPGGDDDEYFELLTEPGASLDGLSYIVIGDGSGGSGVIESITDLTGNSTSGLGYFVCAESSFSLFPPPDLTATLGFENGDNVTHLLVRDFTGVLQEDLDTDDDGVLDTTPWSEVLDAVSLVGEIGGGDQYYGASLGFADLGPSGSFVPAQAVRCNEGWRIGTFGLDGFDTPGNANGFCGGFGPRCGATSDPINQGIVAIEGSCSIQLNDASAYIYDLPVDSFGVLIVGVPTKQASTPYGTTCIDLPFRVSYGFSSGGELTIPLDTTVATGLGVVVGEPLALQYLYRDASAPSGARWTDAVGIVLGL